jgi:hypothetical protein
VGKDTNSLINMVMAGNNNPVPEVGMGATKIMWTDRHPFTVVEVVNERRLVLQADKYFRTDGGGMSDSQEYAYQSDPDGVKVEVTKRKDGSWRVRGGDQLFSIGERSAHFDYNF